MERVGIRQLRQNLNAYLAKVKGGSTFAVTDRGRPVAVLGPLAKEDDTWQRLVDDGVVAPAAGAWSEINPPSGETDWNRTVSKYLQLAREDRI